MKILILYALTLIALWCLLAAVFGLLLLVRWVNITRRRLRRWLGGAARA